MVGPLPLCPPAPHSRAGQVVDATRLPLCCATGLLYPGPLTDPELPTASRPFSVASTHQQSRHRGRKRKKTSWNWIFTGNGRRSLGAIRGSVRVLPGPLLRKVSPSLFTGATVNDAKRLAEQIRTAEGQAHVATGTSPPRLAATPSGTSSYTNLAA